MATPTMCLKCGGFGEWDAEEGPHHVIDVCYHCQATGTCTTDCHICDPNHDFNHCTQCIDYAVMRRREAQMAANLYL